METQTAQLREQNLLRESASTRTQELESLIRSLSEDLNTSTQRCGDLEKQLLASEDQLTAQKNTNATVLDDLSALKADHAALAATTSEEVSRAMAAKEELETVLADARKAAEKLRRENDDLRQQCEAQEEGSSAESTAQAAEVARVQRQAESATAELNALVQKHDELREERDSLAASLGDASTKLEASGQRVGELEQSAVASKAAMVVAEKRAAELEEQLEAEQREHQATKRTLAAAKGAQEEKQALAEIEEALKAAQEKESEATKASLASQMQVRELGDKLSTAEATISTLQNDASIRSEEISALQRRTDELVTAHDAKVQDMAARVTQLEGEAKDRTAAMEEHHREADALRTRLQEEAKALQEQVRAKDEALAGLQTRSEGIKASHDKRVEALKQTVQKLKSALERAHSDKDAGAQKESEATSEAQRAQEEIKDLKGEVEELKSTLASSKTEVEALQTELRSERATAKTGTDEALSLRERLETAEQHVKELQARRVEQNEKIQASEVVVEDLTGKLQALAHKYTEMKDAAVQRQEAADQALQTLSENLQKVSAELETKVQVVAELESKLSEQSAAIEGHESAIEAHSGVQEGYEKQMKELSDTIKDMEGLLSARKAKIGELEGARAALEGKLSSSEELRESYKTRVDDLEGQLEKTSKIQDALGDYKVKAQEAIKQANQRTTETVKEKHAVMVELDELKATAERLGREREGHAKEVDELTAKASALAEQLKSTQRQLREKEAALADHIISERPGAPPLELEPTKQVQPREPDDAGLEGRGSNEVLAMTPRPSATPTTKDSSVNDEGAVGPPHSESSSANTASIPTPISTEAEVHRYRSRCGDLETQVDILTKQLEELQDRLQASTQVSLCMRKGGDATVPRDVYVCVCMCVLCALPSRCAFSTPWIHRAAHHSVCCSRRMQARCSILSRSSTRNQIYSVPHTNNTATNKHPQRDRSRTPTVTSQGSMGSVRALRVPPLRAQIAQRMAWLSRWLRGQSRGQTPSSCTMPNSTTNLLTCGKSILSSCVPWTTRRPCRRRSKGRCVVTFVPALEHPTASLVQTDGLTRAATRDGHVCRCCLWV